MRLLTALALASFCLATVPASAGGINFSTVLTDQDDNPIMDCAKVDAGPPPKCAQETKMTLGRIALGALNKQDQGLTDTDNVTRYYLMLKVYRAVEPIELSGGDVDLIRRQIVKTGYPPLWVGRALEILDPAGMKGK